MALFHPKYTHSFLAAAACSLNRSPFSISSLNHHSSLSKGPKLYACQSGPLSKDEVDDWHRMKCHLGILTRSWESECMYYVLRSGDLHQMTFIKLMLLWQGKNQCKLSQNFDCIIMFLLGTYYIYDIGSNENDWTKNLVNMYSWPSRGRQ